MEYEISPSKRVSPRGSPSASPKRRRIYIEPNHEKSLKLRTSKDSMEKYSTSCIDFEYGPAGLNLYDYLAEEARFVWTKAKTYFILKAESEPKKGILLFHTEGDNLNELCRKHFEFDLHSTTFSKVPSELNDEDNFACVFYLGKHFWNDMQTANTLTLKEMVKAVRKAHLFFITDSEEEKYHAINICRENKICPLTHIFSTESDKSPLYKQMYEILENQITSLLADLNNRASTRSVRHLTSELEELFRKLQSRKKKPKRLLTKQCIDLIKDAYGAGCVGYRLCGNALYIFEDDKTAGDNPKRLQILKSIQEAFDGNVYFKPLHDIISPQCAISCGGAIGKRTGETGTIGTFGKLSSTEASRNIQELIVAISSGHVLEAGADAYVPGTGKVGKCIWPVQSANNMFEVSVIKIDPPLINSLQKVILDKDITLTQISQTDHENRRVFKIGAATGRTEGFIDTVDDFELFGEKVIVIRPNKSKCSKFSDKGDSGAIVLTYTNDEKLHALGVIYGDCFELREFKSLQKKNESIAVILLDALNRFKTAKQQEILLDKI